jgi:hypothetical protein
VRGDSNEGLNYGSEPSLIVKNVADPDFDRRTYIRFDLSGYTNAINSATLRLKVESNDGLSNLDFSMVSNDSWDESMITWSNSPSVGSLISTVAPPAAGQWLELDITSQVNTEISGDGLITIHVENPIEEAGMLKFYSKENGTASNDPQLVIGTSGGGTTTYTLIVTNGSGDGDYEEGTVVNISADGAPTGQQFASWTGDISHVADANSANTTITMPASNVSVEATYEIVYHTISASAGTGGSIDPSGNVSVAEGNNQSFTITADTDYEIGDVTVDGGSVGAINSYEFTNVTTDHTISASFNYVGGTETLSADADAYVRGDGYEGINYGGDPSLIIKNVADPDFDRRIYIRFDLSGYTNAVNSATLRLKVESNDGVSNVDFSMVSNDSWDESTINWNNSPSVGSLISTVAPPAAGQWLELDITSQVNTEISGDGLITIHMENPVEESGMLKIYSKENGTSANDPQLYVDYGSTKSGAITFAIDDTEFDALSVFPNPADDQVSIQVNAEKYDIRIYDVNGKLKNIQRNVIGTRTIQTNEIGIAGVYFIKIFMGDEVLIKKLILK